MVEARTFKFCTHVGHVKY